MTINCILFSLRTMDNPRTPALFFDFDLLTANLKVFLVRSRLTHKETAMAIPKDETSSGNTWTGLCS